MRVHHIGRSNQEKRVAGATRFRGLENLFGFTQQRKASVAFLAPIQATTPKPILLIMSAML